MITQPGSTRGVIDWNSFSIGRHNSVTFDNGSGAILNRVTGGTPSAIPGSLSATGSLYVTNP
ncbi:filamentous hemagglutinin family protein [Paraburkholderia sp. JPY419]